MWKVHAALLLSWSGTANLFPNPLLFSDLLLYKVT
jgi:hypothetical protein